MIGGKAYPALSSFLLVAMQIACLIVLMITGPVFNFESSAIYLLFFSLFLGSWAIMVMLPSKLNIFPEVSKGATLIQKGPYRYIRHPMYLSLILLMISLLWMHFAWYRLLISILLLIDLIIKIEYEERILIRDLAGYKTYKGVTYRLVPCVY